MRENKEPRKAVISVSEMADLLSMSRARFYQLLQAKIFPLPLYDPRTKRPFYPQDLQEKCFSVRETGIGNNGNFILFYSPRKNNKASTKNSPSPKDAQYQDIKKFLKQLGLDVSSKEISTAIMDVFPGGIEDQDQGVVVRDLYRYFKRGV